MTHLVVFHKLPELRNWAAQQVWNVWRVAQSWGIDQQGRTVYAVVICRVEDVKRLYGLRFTGVDTSRIDPELARIVEALCRR